MSYQYYILVSLLVYLSFIWLPHSSSTSDAGDGFSVLNARRYLKDVTDFGVRRSGSIVNEDSLPKYFYSELGKIKKNAQENVKFEVMTQHPSGLFFHKFLNGFMNVYTNITNIAVKISWNDDVQDRNAQDHHTILVNAHYDSFVTSVGASDCALGVAVILELSRVLSRGAPLPHSVVLLLNGAEESNQQGAHSFITQHPWAENIRAVINLEAMGSGGKNFMFQCNSAWVARVYGTSVLYPHGAVLSHELFKNLLWRVAATDFLTFIDFGRKPGIVGTDNAYIEDGYRYHTTFDTADSIPNGTIQHTGENLLSFVHGLAAAPEMKYDDAARAAEANDPYSSVTVYYDFLGLFFVTYSGRFVYLFHSTAAMLGIYVSYQHYSRDIWLLHQILFRKIFVFLSAPVIAVILGSIYHMLAPMVWYDAGLYLALLIYVPPSLLTIEITQRRAGFNHFYDNGIASMLFLSVLLLCSNYAGLVSGYVFCNGVMSMLLLCCCELSFIKYALRKYPRMLAVLPSLVLLPHFAYICQISLLTLTMTVPLIGKTGTVVPGDIILSALIGFLVSILSLLPLSGTSLMNLSIPLHDTSTATYASVSSERLEDKEKLSVKTKKSLHPLQHKNIPRDQLLQSYVIGCLVLCTITLLTSILFLSTYSTSRPKRLWIQHIERNITQNIGFLHNSKGSSYYDSGVWVSALDGRGLHPLRKLVDKDNFDGRYSIFDHYNVAHYADLQTKSHYTDLQTKSKHFFHRDDFNVSFFTSINDIHHPSNDIHHRSDEITGYNCQPWSGLCLLRWPWLFPVAEAIRDSFYIPTEPPDIPPAQRLHLDLFSSSIYQTIENQGLEDNEKKKANKTGVGLRAGLPPQRYVSHISDHSNDKRSTTTTASSSTTPLKRMILVEIKGPTHMALVIRDHLKGKRITSWGMKFKKDLVKDNVVLGITHALILASMIARVRNGELKYIDPQVLYDIFDMTETPEAREDGTLYSQINFGYCPGGQSPGRGIEKGGTCTQYVVLELTSHCCEHDNNNRNKKSNFQRNEHEGIINAVSHPNNIYIGHVSATYPIDVSAYGHYVHLPEKSYSALTKIKSDLPSWSVGAEWTYFSSSLIASQI